MLKARNLLLAAALGTVAVLAVPASAQNRDWHDQNRWGWQDRDHDRDDHDWDEHDRNRQWRGNSNSSAYQDGYRDAQQDRSRSGHYHPRGDRWKGDDRNAYESGYRAGYGNGQYGYGNGGWNGRDRDRDHDRDGRWNGGYGNGAYGYPSGAYGYGYGRQGGPAAQFGYQDGFSYGQRDASSGKGYNATGSQYYEDADHGYNSRFGDRNSYRQGYRQAYQQGYQDGYYGRGGRRY